MIHKINTDNTVAKPKKRSAFLALTQRQIENDKWVTKVLAENNMGFKHSC